MASVAVNRGRVEAAEGERGAIERIERFLAGSAAEELALVGSTEERIALPPSVRGLLRQIVHELAIDHAVVVVPVEKLLTTQQAADLLDVSRPSLIGLLEAGEIASSLVGTHRRVSLDDLVAYKSKQDAERQDALTRLTQMSQEMGLYPSPRGVRPPTGGATPAVPLVADKRDDPT